MEVNSAVNSRYFGLVDLFKSWDRSYKKAAKNYCASCCEYPLNLDFFAPIAFLSSYGAYDLDVDVLMVWINDPYACATLALVLI